MNEKEAAAKIKKDFEDLFYTAVGFSVLSGRRIYGTVREIAKEYRPEVPTGHVRETAEHAFALFKGLAKDVLANVPKRRKGSDPGR